MDLGDAAATTSAVKFVSGNISNICRLCLTTTKQEEISLIDVVRVQRSYFDETVTFMDMFLELGVSTEPLLPQGLCMDCSTIIINSYLFQQLCRHSDDKWTQALGLLEEGLSNTDSIDPKFKTAYLVLNQNSNLTFTSKRSYKGKKKSDVLNKIVKSIASGKKRYKQVKKKKSTICDRCGYQCDSKLTLLRHKKMHLKGQQTQFGCSDCSKCFQTQHQLEEHAERIHYPKKIQCPQCAKMFSTERTLKQHHRMHHVAAICKECSIQFPSKNALRAHLDKHDVLVCPKCNKSLLNKQTYKIHIKNCGKTDRKEPTCFCDICGKGYVKKNSLRTHLKIGHGFGGGLTCNWCSKKFDAKSRLMNHVVKHTRERNFNCEHCGGRFVTQAALVYHIRLHTGERPYPCDLCSESFLSASRRMEHKRRKHFEPTKECHICHVKFVTGFQLRKHVQRHSNPQSKLFVPLAEADFFYN